VIGESCELRQGQGLRFRLCVSGVYFKAFYFKAFYFKAFYFKAFYFKAFYFRALCLRLRAKREARILQWMGLLIASLRMIFSRIANIPRSQ
jgi:hypothetical protein